MQARQDGPPRGQAVQRNNEAALERAVAGQPVTVAIDASGRGFQFYKRGVFSGPCSTKLNHAGTAVGSASSPAAAASTGSSKTRGASRGVRRDTCEWRGIPSQSRISCSAREGYHYRPARLL